MAKISERVVIDAGPLVALVDQNDRDHEACKQIFDLIRRPAYTTWPVVTEAVWLLRTVHGGPQLILSLIESEIFIPFELGSDAATWMRNFLDRYADLRPQLADASLVYAAEQLGTETIFTLDRRDFHVFRSARGRAFRLVPETI